MKICMAIFSVVMLVIPARPCDAQSYRPAAQSLSDFGSVEFRNIDRAGLAKRVLNYCKEVLEVLPRNTPREESWVDDEFKSGNWDRMARAGQSVEFARSALVTLFNDCTSHSSKLINLASPQPATEAVLWTRLAMAFSTTSANDLAERLGLTKYDEKNGWIDPHALKSLPLMIRMKSHIAVIESLGQKP